MAAPSWQISGQYYENCSCDFVCPCVPTQMQGRPTNGSCTFAMAFEIERGRFGDVPLQAIGFMVLGSSPEAMAKGDWSVGLVIDERASQAQRDAITAIASGSEGGPMAALGGLVGKFVDGSESRFESLYLDVLPERRLVYVYDMYWQGKKISVSLASVEFVLAGKGTKLVLTEQHAFLDGYEDGGSRERGTRSLFDNLGVALAGGDARRPKA